MGANLPAGLGLEFSETMRGFWAGDPTLDFGPGYAAGLEQGNPVEFHLTLSTANLAATLDSPAHEFVVTGQLSAPALAAAPLEVLHGSARLLIAQPQNVGVRLMRYSLQLGSNGAVSCFFDGTKTVRDDGHGDAWADTSTLMVEMFAGTDRTGQLLGRGIMHLLVADFVKQLGTIQVRRAPDRGTELAAIAAFGTFFAGELFQIYGTLAAPLRGFDPAAAPRRRRTLQAPLPELVPLAATDGTALRLTRFRGGNNGPVMLVHGLGVSSRIFSTDTIDVNLVEYLCAHQFDVWLLDYRASVELPASRTAFSADDVALRDLPAAVDKIRAATNAASIQAIVHCFGAMSFAMAVLAGLKGVRSAVMSQVATHVVAGPAATVKAGLFLPNVLDIVGVATMSAAASVNDDVFVKLLDELLRLQAPQLRQRCTSRTCHRIAFMYAPLFEHAQLNNLTHECLHELFGVANMTSFEHLARIVRKGEIVSADGRDAYLPHLARLAALPLTFIHGENNECYLPESTRRTFEALDALAPQVPRKRHVIARYGHIDCIFGKDAARDVYPHILEHLLTIGR